MNEIYIEHARMKLGSILKALGEAMLKGPESPTLGSLQISGGYVTDMEVRPWKEHGWNLKFNVASAMNFEDVAVQCPTGENINLKCLHITGLALQAKLLPAYEGGQAVVFEVDTPTPHIVRKVK